MKTPSLATLIVGAALVASACSSTSPTGPSATAAAPATGITANMPDPPNNQHPGTGNNGGFGGGNSCTDVAPTIAYKNQDGPALKFGWNHAGGAQVRGYQARLSTKDADRTPYTAPLKNTNVDDGQQGRELRILYDDYDPGQWTLEVRTRRVGCPTEFGQWSTPFEFNMPGDVNTTASAAVQALVCSYGPGGAPEICSPR